MKVEINNKVIRSVSLGYGNLAWKITDCLIIFEYMKEKGIYILGGDVLDHNRKYVYAMWDYKTDSNLSYVENANKSIEKAAAYISWFEQEIGTNYYIDITVDNQSDAIWPPKKSRKKIPE